MSRAPKAVTLILRVIGRANKPISSQDIQKEIPEIDRATVYRTLKRLKEKQLVRLVELGDGVVRYESVTDHHHHLICLKCNTVHKIELPRAEEDHFLKVQEDFERKSGFSSLQHSLEFFGLCKKCQNVKTVQK